MALLVAIDRDEKRSAGSPDLAKAATPRLAANRKWLTIVREMADAKPLSKNG